MRTPDLAYSVFFFCGSLIASTRFEASAFVVGPKSLSRTTRVKDGFFPKTAPELKPTRSPISLSATTTTTTTTAKKNKKKKRRYNPLWPNGLDKEDIDELVESILSDETINIPSIPDVLERKIYRSTIVLTLNAVYRGIGWVHGKTLLGHDFSVVKMKRDESRAARMRQKALLTMKSDVDEELLEEIADRLLANAAVNQVLIPDVVERAVYISCLKIVFRILNMLAASFRITLCGHDLTLSLEKAVTRLQVLNAAQEAASSATAIDTALLRELAREIAVDTEEEALLGEEGGSMSVESDDDNDGDASLWSRGKSLIKSSQDEFVIQLHAVLYSLILGILDDLLANTELVLMSDRIHFDIVPKTKTVNDEDEVVDETPAAEVIEELLVEQSTVENGEMEPETSNDEDGSSNKMEETTPKRRRASRVLTFLAGVVLGVCGTTLRSVVQQK